MKTSTRLLSNFILLLVFLFGLTQIAFTLPNAQLSFGGSVTACSQAEGSAVGWPFQAFVPGCGNGASTNTIAFIVDIIIAGFLAAGLVIIVNRLLWRKQSS